MPENASLLALCPDQLAEQRAPALTAALRGERPRNEQALLTSTLMIRQNAGTVCTRLSVPEESS